MNQPTRLLRGIYCCVLAIKKMNAYLKEIEIYVDNWSFISQAYFATVTYLMEFPLSLSQNASGHTSKKKQHSTMLKFR